MAWALQQQETSDPTARHVLLCLANYAGADGLAAFPSTSTLARDSGLSERTIRAKLDQLETLGLIRLGNQAIAAAHIRRADRRPTVFDLVLSRGAPAAPRSFTGCNSRPNGVQLTPERGATDAPDPRALSEKLENRSLVDKREARGKGTPREGEHLKSIQEILRGVTA